MTDWGWEDGAHVRETVETYRFFLVSLGDGGRRREIARYSIPFGFKLG